MNIETGWADLRQLDLLAESDTPLHRLNAAVKLLTTFAFVIVVASFPKYEVTSLLPLVLYPVALVSLGGLPWSHLIRRLALVAPFALCIGLFNPWFDRTPLVQWGSVAISAGWVSFFSILLRLALTVTAALALVATSGFNNLCAAMSRLGMPRILAVQLMFMYRYLYILTEEAARMLRAHGLRSGLRRGLGFNAWGSFLGQLLFRAVDRAQRIYQAMLCRGFDGQIRLRRSGRVAGQDIAFLLGWTLYFLAARLYNIPLWLGTLLTGGRL